MDHTNSECQSAPESKHEQDPSPNPVNYTEPKNVIYMYPNALYAQVEYENGMMTLIRGHGYPDILIGNGFGWQYDNTHPYEYDTKCEKWEFKEVSNGWQLNCTPELSFYDKPEIIYKMKLLS